ncbi:MAG: GNAT family N-acetyltransferase, partial [Chitinophagaceae bacterium]
MEISQLKTISETEAQEIYLLSNQLGYNNDFDLLAGRLKQIISLDDQVIYVAKIDDRIVGWLHGVICLRVESPLFVEVTGLVVDENVRGKQIGKNLIEASKNWSRSQNIFQLRI